MNKTQKLALAALAALTVLTGGIAFAQSDKGDGHSMMGGGMMNGMMGNMMSQCKKMMGEDSAGQVRLPELPPGNEALQFRMHAEMLQKIGEIAVGYADRVDTGK